MTASALARQLERFGPDQQHHPPMSLAAARKYCRGLAQSHYENFTVASWLLPRRLRSHFHAVYAYCRWADDLADETESPQQSLELLTWWESQLQACYAGHATHPVFIALAATIQQFAIPATPFHDLLVAFRRDQTQQRYASLDDLLDYCRYSANPVGRLVLYLGECCDARRAALADKICTGLQLVNFWQDIGRDWQRGRLYVPADRMAEHGVARHDFDAERATPALRALLAEEVDRARGYLLSGLPLASLMPGRLRFDIELFARGGLAVCDAIEKIGYDVLHQRPALSRGRKIRLALAALPRFGALREKGDR
ncbi:MAG: squalene synthase HpnC [Planctomycetales bacterium]|nr:squalene synthase HpnC [Planctomycetales bacterium]